MRPLALILAVFLAGCAGVPRRLPSPGAVAVAHLMVFCDGFHSGIVVPRSALPLDLDPPPVFMGWTARSFHYGERAWTSGEDVSACHAVRLAFLPGDGVIQSDPTGWLDPEIPGTDRMHFRVWRFPVSRAALAALEARLRSAWIVMGSLEHVPGEPSVLFTSRTSWSVWCNCHDFTADLLEAAGLALPHHLIGTAGVLAKELDLAVGAMETAGIAVLDPVVRPPGWPADGR